MRDDEPILPPSGSSWQDRPAHRRWLEGEADALFSFFQGPLIDPAGGFFGLNREGQPIRDAGPRAPDPQHGPHGPLLRHRTSPRPSRMRGDHRPRRPVSPGRSSRSLARRLRLVRRRRGPPRRHQAGLRPCLRAPGRRERQGRGPSPGGCPARGRSRGHRDPLLGRAARRGARGIRPGLVAAGIVSRAEFQHASDRSPDGGLRGDRRARSISTGRNASPD